jgi:hypothetical protein
MLSTQKSFIFTIIAAFVLISSGAFNIYQYTTTSKYKLMYDVITERSRINDDEFREIFLSRNNDIRENTIELARNQGRIEGLLAAGQNLPIQDSDVSALYHASADSGYQNAMYVMQSSVSSIDEKIKEFATIIEKNSSKEKSKQIIESWENTKKFIDTSIKNADQNNSKINTTISWKKSLINRSREKEINDIIEEAKEEGRIQGYHDATEQGICPANKVQIATKNK